MGAEVPLLLVLVDSAKNPRILLRFCDLMVPRLPLDCWELSWLLYHATLTTCDRPKPTRTTNYNLELGLAMLRLSQCSLHLAQCQTHQEALLRRHNHCLPPALSHYLSLAVAKLRRDCHHLDSRLPRNP